MLLSTATLALRAGPDESRARLSTIRARLSTVRLSRRRSCRLADVDFGVRHNDQTWRTQTNANGDYIVIGAAGRRIRCDCHERRRVAAIEPRSPCDEAGSSPQISHCGRLLLPRSRRDEDCGSMQRDRRIRSQRAGSRRGCRPRSLARVARRRVQLHTPRMQRPAGNRSRPLAASAISRHCCATSESS